MAQQVGLSQACRALGLPRAQFYRQRQRAQLPEIPNRSKASPARSLSPEEREQVLQVLNSERFQDCAPREVYAALLDEQTYLCSWRTMYRILNDTHAVRERRNQLQRPNYTKPELLATQANQLWS